MSYAESVEVIKQEGREEGWEDGLREGFVNGREETLIDQICKKVRRGMILERIAGEIEESVEYVRPIYDAVRKAAPRYDLQEIRGILHARATG